jgi:hypothetical protein
MTRPASTCPLCGEANHCALARGDALGECWCVAERFQPELLASVDDADRDRCICRACLARAEQTSDSR